MKWECSEIVRYNESSVKWYTTHLRQRNYNLRNLVPVKLEALPVQGLGANLSSAGDSNEKGVISDVIKPPVVHSGKQTSTVHTRVNNTFALDIIPEKDLASYRTSHQETNMWHGNLEH